MFRENRVIIFLSHFYSLVISQSSKDELEGKRTPPKEGYFFGHIFQGKIGFGKILEVSTRVCVQAIDSKKKGILNVPSLA